MCFVIGFVIGVLAGWWYLKRQHQEQIDTLNDKLSRVEAELVEERRAHEAVKGQLSDTTAAPSLAKAKVTARKSSAKVTAKKPAAMVKRAATKSKGGGKAKPISGG